MDILVTGGTGTLGRLVVAQLSDAGHRVRVMTRAPKTANEVRGDLDGGDGVEAAVAGAGVIVHLAGSSKGDDDKARALVAAVHATGGRPHLVHISVVGADRVPVRSRVDRALFGYIAAKRGAEEVVMASGLPWTILRATQFHELMLTTVAAMAKLPLIPAPREIRVQPVAAAEVAARLVELAQAEPAGLVDDVAGPTTYAFRDLVRAYLRSAGKHRAIVGMPLPGAAARAFRAGANLSPEHAVGRRTWEQFLAAGATG
jgi:uncharacterized protein YbjT (DUF2867 family)